MSSDIADWINNSLKDIHHEDFKDVCKVLDAKEEPTGDGQALIVSEVNRVTLSLETILGNIKTLKAIIKKETSGPGKGLLESVEIFESEIWIYAEVLNSMQNLMAEVNDYKHIWPKWFHFGYKKLLLEDLCESGFSIVPMKNLLDVDHTIIAMKALGKFHGLSMVLKERGLLNTSKLKPVYYSQRVPFVISFHKHSVSSVAKIIREDWGEEWLPVASRLEKLVENPGDSMCNMVQAAKGKWEVLNHGDFSMRNMLFHYQAGTSIPDSVKFVDFQTCCYDHMGYDLVTLLYTSLLPELRDANMEHFLQNYRDSLVEACKTHSFNGPLPSVQDVKDCIKAISYLTAVLPLCYLTYATMCKNGNVQQKVNDGIQLMMSNDPPKDMPLSDDQKIIYRDPETVSLLQYEIKRLIKENVI